MNDQATQTTTEQPAVTIPKTPIEQMLDEYASDEPSPAAAAPEPAQPIAPPPPPAPKHSPDTARRAADYGVSEAELNDMSPQEANRYLNGLERQRQEFIRWHAQQQQAQPTQPVAAPATPAVDEDDFTQALREVGGKEEDWDPTMLKALKKVHGKKENAEIKKLEERLAKAEQVIQSNAEREQQRAAQEAAKEFDDLFTTDPTRFGQGSTFTLPKGSPQILARIETLQLMQSIDNGFRAMGKQPPPLKDLHAQAVAMLYGGQAPAPQAPAPQPVDPNAAELERRKQAYAKAAVATPTARTEKATPNGRKAAIEAVAEWQRNQNGVPVHTSTNDDEEEGLPG
jgi:hypothetical protein